jgi:hypothetical protein
MIEWEEYKQVVSELRLSIALQNRNLYDLLDHCNCNETTPKANYGNGDRHMPATKTTWDECILCMRMYNTKTKVQMKPREKRK